MRRVLIISPHFPPINAPDMQRVRMSLRHYRDHGWEPIVLCAVADEVDGVSEPELLHTLPPDARVVRSRCLPLRWTRWVGVRNIGLRCWLHFLLAGARIIRDERIDLVFFSNTQFVTFTLGRIWHDWLGTPYVFDVQDPWRTDYYQRPGAHAPPGGWKYQIARSMAWLLEGWSFRHVAAIMSVSPNYLADLTARYPRLARRPTALITFGVSRDDLDIATRLETKLGNYQRTHGEVHLVYTGVVGPVMARSLEVLLAGLRAFRKAKPEQARRLRLHFFGTSYAASGRAQHSVLPSAEQFGLADQVEEIPGRLGHLECLRLQRDADALVLLSSNEPAYSPSKVYPYFLSGRPILAIVHEPSVLERLLSELACATLVRVSGDASPTAPPETLIKFLDEACSGFESDRPASRNWPYFESHFLAPALTANQCRLFDQALTNPSSFA